MNLRMFPVHSNSSRRLRRTLSSSSVYLERSTLASNQSIRELSSLQPNDLLNFGSSTASLSSLNQADQEMLLRQRAMDQAQQGNLGTAITLFTQLIRYNPSSAGNFNNRGLLFFQQGELEQALADYNQALALNSRLAKVYNNRANCYAALNKVEWAIADYETAIDLDPTDMRARLNQAITLRQMSLYELAIEGFDLALQLSQFLNSTDAISIPSSLEGHLYAERGRTHHLLGDWNYAIADYYRALERLPFPNSTIDPSQRLRTSVRNWMEELLSPLKVE